MMEKMDVIMMEKKNDENNDIKETTPAIPLPNQSKPIVPLPLSLL